LVAAPFAYRDPRTTRVVPHVHEIVPFEELYRRNGLQFLPFNTIYQLAVDAAHGSLDAADDILLIPDLLAFDLTGHRGAEVTNASTTGLLGLDRQWDTELMDRLGLPHRIFPALRAPGET